MTYVTHLRFSRLLAAVCAATAVACAAEPASDEASSSASLTATSWQRVLTCGNGGIVIDVDANERRHLQAVIRDAHAVDWLLANQPGLELGEGRINTFAANDRHELILPGTVHDGVFAPGDFHGLASDHEGWAVATVTRDGAGVRVALSDESHGHPTHEHGNWFFSDCR